MGENSKISWCHHTFNSWWGCSKVPGDPACHNCYAETLSKRYGFKIWGQNKPRRTLSDNHWKGPLKWNRKAAEAGERHRVFCSSMADVFEDRRDLDDLRARLWDLIDETESLDWLLLTKRPANIIGMMTAGPSNVWLGTTAVTQAHYDLRVPDLLCNQAAVHFVSVEPQMESIDLHLDEHPVTWVIVGGESGNKARFFDIDWARDIIAQCRDAGVACFVKQLGAKPGFFPGDEATGYEGIAQHLHMSNRAGADPSEWPADLRVQEFPA